MHQHGHDDPNAKKLYELIKDVKIAMMTTAEGGKLHTRPMYNMDADEHGDLWFFTQIGSAKIQEVSRDSEVSLGYSDPSSQTYVAVTGRAEIVRDKAKIDEKWSEPLRGMVSERQGRPRDRTDSRPSGAGRVLGQPFLDPRAPGRLREGCGDGRTRRSGRSRQGRPSRLNGVSSSLLHGDILIGTWSSLRSLPRKGSDCAFPFRGAPSLLFGLSDPEGSWLWRTSRPGYTTIPGKSTRSCAPCSIRISTSS